MRQSGNATTLTAECGPDCLRKFGNPFLYILYVCCWPPLGIGCPLRHDVTLQFKSYVCDPKFGEFQTCQNPLFEPRLVQGMYGFGCQPDPSGPHILRDCAMSPSKNLTNYVGVGHVPVFTQTTPLFEGHTVRTGVEYNGPVNRACDVTSLSTIHRDE